MDTLVFLENTVHLDGILRPPFVAVREEMAIFMINKHLLTIALGTMRHGKKMA